MTDADIHALVGAYALDAVDDLERVAFERHLAGCPNCQAEADELRETATRLADTTWSVPPPRLRAEVLTQIGRTRQLAPNEPARPERDARAAVSRWRRFTIGAAAAAVLAAGAGAATWAVQEQRVHDERAVAAAAHQREVRTQAILAAPDLVVRTSPMVGGGRLTVAYSASQGSSVVAVRADSAPGSDRAFELWTIRGTGSPVEVGLLAAGEQSAVRIVDGVPGNDVFAVSLEPAHGSPTPTDIRARVDLI
ncbi:MAG TPA: anti-sigma factor [Actinoplanes sp.]|nr:anti-sigma factor [Actinoplanes sp.]